MARTISGMPIARSRFEWGQAEVVGAELVDLPAHELEGVHAGVGEQEGASISAKPRSRRCMMQ
jgi:hypothetical protein